MSKALALLIVLLLASPTRADEPRARLHATAGLRFEAGLGSEGGLTLGLLSLGVDWHLASSFVLSARGLGLVPFGASDDGAAHAGGGGELGLRLVPLPDGDVQPWLGASAGLLFFGRDTPFLPGGDLYDFVLSYGLGLDVHLGRLTLGADVHYVHLSNGQGLVAANPAFDGVGVGLVARWALTQPEELTSAWDRFPEPHGGRPCFQLGWTVDLDAGHADDASLYTLRVRFMERLSETGLVLVDLEGGSLADARLLEGGIALVEQLDVATLGVHVGYRDFVGIDTVVAAIQAEVHASREVSIVALGELEATAGGDPLGRAGLGLRAYPFPSLFVEVGVGFDRIGEQALDDASDPYLGLEWQLPFHFDNWQFSLFAERQISTIDMVGIRVAFTGAGYLTLRDVDRHTAWRRLR